MSNVSAVLGRVLQELEGRMSAATYQLLKDALDERAALRTAMEKIDDLCRNKYAYHMDIDPKVGRLASAAVARRWGQDNG
jgi:hypothetical protein